MKYAVCTLFEGHYAMGVGALVNSLVAAGFKGGIYAGHRGAAPSWRLDAATAAGVHLHFVPLDTDYHLTNYKPHFMLRLLDADPTIDHITYIDPDIVVTASWPLMCDWFQCGVALCEDVNSPVSAFHPRRMGWRQHFASVAPHMTCRTESYVNGGFVAVHRRDRAFLDQWRLLSEEMGRVIGGLGVAKLSNGRSFVSKGFANCFSCSDQDALNATVECDTPRASILGREAMGFSHGEIMMLHAIGTGKPWERRFMIEAVRGNSPRMVDKVFLTHARQPIPVLSSSQAFLKTWSIQLAVAINRVWKRA